jgi:benzoyl-CoA 2,3-dioxygenase component B
MFTYFTDRDGKFQLGSLAESGFDPLARTCRFMLTEEGHHMFIGDTGLSRVTQRTCEMMKELKTDDPARVREAGAIDLPTMQRYINFHFSVSIDLFGQELSTNAANYYTQGLKGRFEEAGIDDDHKLTETTYGVSTVKGDEIVIEQHPALTAVNERLRDDYVKDCQRGVGRWNKIIKRYGVDFEFKLPHRAFHRVIGAFSELRVSPGGKLVTDAEWTRHVNDWMPSEEDRAFVISLISKPVHEPGKMAGWIAPPARGIDGHPLDFEYVRFN